MKTIEELYKEEIERQIAVFQRAALAVMNDHIKKTGMKFIFEQKEEERLNSLIRIKNENK